jgi:hypothetical protein
MDAPPQHKTSQFKIQRFYKSVKYHCIVFFFLYVLISHWVEEILFVDITMMS